MRRSEGSWSPTLGTKTSACQECGAGSEGAIAVIWHRFRIIAIGAVALWLVCANNAQQSLADSFVITISLPKSSVHVGGDLEIGLVFSNPTVHIVTMDEGQNGGMDIEALNEKGDNIGPYISGSANANRIPRSNFMLNRSTLRPGHKQTFVWDLKPDPKYLIPGTYKLRIHNRDLDKGSEVYSNSVILTVLP
jgi:hypothetical protein